MTRVLIFLTKKKMRLVDVESTSPASGYVHYTTNAKVVPTALETASRQLLIACYTYTTEHIIVLSL